MEALKFAALLSLLRLICFGKYIDKRIGKRSRRQASVFVKDNECTKTTLENISPRRVAGARSGI